MEIKQKMRELKFRVWDNDKYHGPFILGPTKIAELRSTKESDYTPNMIFQQFTGIFDGNKKEIYEGDIIEIRYNLDIIKEKNILYGRYYVEYRPPMFGFFEKCFPGRKGYENLGLFHPLSDNIGSYIQNCSIKIIGNIFENKDIL